MTETAAFPSPPDSAGCSVQAAQDAIPNDQPEEALLRMDLIDATFAPVVDRPSLSDESPVTSDVEPISFLGPMESGDAADNFLTFSFDTAIGKAGTCIAVCASC